MQYTLGFIGIIVGCLLIKFRQRVGDEFGDPDWAAKVGGMYNVVIIVAVFIFFWSIATITGTTDFLLAPILNALPLQHKTEQGAGGIPLDMGN